MVVLGAIVVGTVVLARAAQCTLEWIKMIEEDEAMEREMEGSVMQASLVAISVEVMGKSLPNGEVEYQSLDSNVLPSEVEHYKHPHVLKQMFSEETFECDGCGESGKGNRYCCQDCEKESTFQLHMCCSLPPTMLTSQSPSLLLSTNQYQPILFQSAVHKEHQVKEVYKNAKFKCNRCKTKGNGTRYHCDSCNIDFHQVCAERPYKVSTFMHPQHELVLKTRQLFFGCALCRQKGDATTRLYQCEECDFYVHPNCIQWPQYLLHSLHPHHTPHPLQLKRMSSSHNKPCDARCGKKCKKWRYTCEICDVHFHLNCLLAKSMNSDASTNLKVKLLKYAIKHALDLTLAQHKIF